MKKPTKKKKKKNIGLVKELPTDNRFIDAVINGFEKLFSPN